MTALNAPAAVALVIPTYNNGATIEAVVRAAYRFVPDIFIVNDGSTDDTAQRASGLLPEMPGVRVISIPSNRGKGFAIKRGFERALAEGFTNAITMDADGQHGARDLAPFMERVRLSPLTLWIGDRAIQDGAIKEPTLSIFGRAFGAFWYGFFTGKNIRDTQCGFRAYPLRAVLDLKCLGERFDYEQEALIYSVWNGIDVESCAIHRKYLPKNERVSHFRPMIDFLSIGKVNSKAALVKILMPWKTVNSPGKTWREKLMIVFNRELHAHSPGKNAFSLAMGVCMGIMPIYGFQLAVLVALTPILRLNWPLAFLGSCVSLPPAIPFLIAAGVAVGKVITPLIPGMVNTASRIGIVAKGGIEWIVGSVALALMAGIVSYAVFFPVLLNLNRRKNLALKKNV
jgi:glycosyltransferase involved in cell wall biosynthesis